MIPTYSQLAAWYLHLGQRAPWRISINMAITWGNSTPSGTQKKAVRMAKQGQKKHVISQGGPGGLSWERDEFDVVKPRINQPNPTPITPEIVV